MTSSIRRDQVISISKTSAISRTMTISVSVLTLRYMTTVFSVVMIISTGSTLKMVMVIEPMATSRRIDFSPQTRRVSNPRSKGSSSLLPSREARTSRVAPSQTCLRRSSATGTGGSAPSARGSRTSSTPCSRSRPTTRAAPPSVSSSRIGAGLSIFIN